MPVLTRRAAICCLEAAAEMRGALETGHEGDLAYGIVACLRGDAKVVSLRQAVLPQKFRKGFAIRFQYVAQVPARYTAALGHFRVGQEGVGEVHLYEFLDVHQTPVRETLAPGT